MTTLPLTEAKAKLNELVEDAVTTHERLISVEDLESMEETLYWQAQPGVREDIESARREAAAGQLHDETSVRRQYGVGSSR